MSTGRQLPWLPWFHRDFLAATQGWTLLERGAYFMLLCASWELGALPDDHRRLASIIGAQLDELEGVWPLVGRKFEATAAGLVNRRLEEHRAAQLEKCDKARDAAFKRWGRNASADADASPNGHADASETHSSEHMRTDMHPEPEPEPEPESDSEPRSGVLEDSDSSPRQARTRERPAYEAEEFHQQIIAAYHEICTALPRVKDWTKTRKAHLNARIRERLKRGKPADTVDYWCDVFETVASTPFLCGRNDRGWRASLPWLLESADRFAKVIEGQYRSAERGFVA